MIGTFYLRCIFICGHVSPITFLVCSVTIIGIPNTFAARTIIDEAYRTP